MLRIKNERHFVIFEIDYYHFYVLLIITDYINDKFVAINHY